MLPMPLTDATSRAKATRVMGEPRDWNSQEKGECLDLEIHDGKDAQGASVMVSAWRLEEGGMNQIRIICADYIEREARCRSTALPSHLRHRTSGGLTLHRRANGVA